MDKKEGGKKPGTKQNLKEQKKKTQNFENSAEQAKFDKSRKARRRERGGRKKNIYQR